jgi:hypothetical protein
MQRRVGVVRRRLLMAPFTFLLLPRQSLAGQGRRNVARSVSKTVEDDEDDYEQPWYASS